MPETKERYSDMAGKDRRQTGFKLVMVLAPFLLVVALGLVEWWIRARTR